MPISKPSAHHQRPLSKIGPRWVSTLRLTISMVYLISIRHLLVSISTSYRRHLPVSISTSYRRHLPVSISTSYRRHLPVSIFTSHGHAHRFQCFHQTMSMSIPFSLDEVHSVLFRRSPFRLLSTKSIPFSFDEVHSVLFRRSLFRSFFFRECFKVKHQNEMIEATISHTKDRPG